MFCREALVWRQLQHPHVLPFLGVDVDTFPGSLCMVSPWLQRGTLSKHLEKIRPLNANVNQIVRFLFFALLDFITQIAVLSYSKLLKASSISIHRISYMVIYVACVQIP